MDLIEALKDESIDVRVKCQDRWLIWVSASTQCQVWEHKYRARSNTCLCSGWNLESALVMLTGKSV